MCSTMVLPTLGRTLFRNNEAQLSGTGVGSGVTVTDTRGKTEPHEFIDFCSFAASGLDMDSDVDMSNNIGHIITSLSSLHSFGSQLGRGADQAQDFGYGVDLRQWQPEEKRSCDPLWSSELQQTDFATLDGYASSPDRFSDSGAELFDTDSNAKTSPQLPDCLPPPPPPTTASTQLRPRLSSEEEEEDDVLMTLQPLQGLQPLQVGPGIAGSHGQTQVQELDIEKLVTDYLYDQEDVSQQTARLDELAAALSRVSGLPAPAPTATPAALPAVADSRPLGPVQVPVRSAAPWGGPEGGSSILEGVLRGTLTPVARVTSPPRKPVQHFFPTGGFHAYPSGSDVRGHGLPPVTSGFPCDGSSAGSPVRMDCALSPVAASPDVFGSGGPLTSPQPQAKKDASRKRKYGKRSAVEGDAPPSTRGRLLHFCPICSKGFKDKYSVNVHIRTHTGEKPFQCELCNKCFRQKAHLAKHVHIHSSPKTPPTKR